eukprot:scaffold136819_cov33-Attheya_sp.AAC.1
MLQPAAAAHNGTCEPAPPGHRSQPASTVWYASISNPIIDELHAHYQKQTEIDIKYPRNTTTTTITTSPTHYDKIQLAKSNDNNETYDATLQESTIKMPQFINDPDDQYQKEDENDIQCTLDTTSIRRAPGPEWASSG